MVSANLKGLEFVHSNWYCYNDAVLWMLVYKIGDLDFATLSFSKSFMGLQSLWHPKCTENITTNQQFFQTFDQFK